jgi:acetyltransferase-like isoleucine patch superfamily enzyme
VRAATVLLLGCVLAAPRDAPAQPSFGREIPVASGARLASVAMGGRGEFVVLWDDSAREGRGLFGQAFERRGRRRGDAFQVSGPGFYLSTASAAMDAQGEFVVAWQFFVDSGETDSYGYHFGRHHLYTQRFDRNGTALGPQAEIASNDGYGSTALRPTVAMNQGGAFVVVWYDSTRNLDDSGGLEVLAQRFERSGHRVGEPLRVNDARFSHFWQPDVAMAEDASFVVMWDYPPSSTLSGELGVSAARFSSGGERIGDEIEVVAPDRGRRETAAVASAADGSFAVVWADVELGILGRRYDAGGAALDDPFLISGRPSAGQRFPVIAMSPTGASFVAWIEGGPDSAVIGRHLDADGGLLGAEVTIVSGASRRFHEKASVAMGGDGSVVVAWETFEGRSHSVYARVAPNHSGDGGGGGDPGGGADRDGDGVIDALDNCPTVPNPDQLDAADDGYGDDCVSPDVLLPPDLRLGANPIIGAGTRIGIRVTIGDDVVIGEHADIRRNVLIDRRASIGPLVTLFPGAFIGAGARVETGATVGRRATVRPGAVVPAGASVPPGATVP